ncbi:MAG: TRC40/GET3/ArsA family transport-energizing ATPase [Sulfolobales archaeon]|nr:TRC40/GET3/ArsA family transport-energizing ATPase [Sulfolobales archaeon]MDW8082350.1 TRC40/GET3/ArsA family transport-energizing ATPase [Sulfolobales archaeon]
MTEFTELLELRECCPHLVMVVGKGGVGKTTVAILIAIELSRRGKTLLLSLDPAKHIVKYLGLTREDLEEIEGGIHVRYVSIEREVSSITSRYADLVRELMPSLSVLNLDSVVDVIKYSPGVEEEVLLRKLKEALSSDFNYVVVDTPPTGVTLRTLILPRLYSIWLNKLIEIRERIVSLRYVIARTMKRNTDVRDRALLKLYEMRDDFKNIDSVLSSESRSSYVLVATPEPLPMYELRETYEFLKNKLSVKPKLLILNKVIPDELAAKLGVLAIQQNFLEELKSFGVSYAVIEHLGRPTENLSDIKALKEKIKVFK